MSTRSNPRSQVMRGTTQNGLSNSPLSYLSRLPSSFEDWLDYAYTRPRVLDFSPDSCLPRSLEQVRPLRRGSLAGNILWLAPELTSLRTRFRCPISPPTLIVGLLYQPGGHLSSLLRNLPKRDGLGHFHETPPRRRQFFHGLDCMISDGLGLKDDALSPRRA